ncbi:hypothetical protein H0H93_002359 [Arthromyces matolae]|nr:hypothetical protein H0H93_002359 [Arthromyces matolae]
MSLSVTSPRIARPIRGSATIVANQGMNPLLARLPAAFLRSSVTHAVELVTFKNCGRFGHIARSCPNGTAGGFASRVPPPGRSLNTSALPPVKCYRCGGPNHMARDCLAPTPGATAVDSAPAGIKSRTCFKCQQEGHIARDCPENADYTA